MTSSMASAAAAASSSSAGNVRTADYKPSASGEKAIQRMMDKWRDDDRKLELEERDRAVRAAEMRREGQVLLAREDEAVGIVVKTPPPRSSRWLRRDEDSGDEGDGEKSEESSERYRDPALEDPSVVNRSAPHGMPDRVTTRMLTIREMDKTEMSMAFAWMWQDEEDYPDNPNKWWTRAAKGLMVGWEDGEGRLTGAFLEGIAFPVAFAITKTGGEHLNLMIDAVGVRRCFRGLGIGAAYVQHYFDAAWKVAEDPDKMLDWYEIEAVPNAVGFWKRMGFEPIPKEERPARYKNKTCLWMRKPLWDEEAELLEIQREKEEQAAREAEAAAKKKEEEEAAARHAEYLAKKEEARQRARAKKAARLTKQKN